MKISKTSQASIRKLSKCTKCPEKAYIAMKSIIMATLKQVQAEYVVDLMKKLKCLNITTTHINNLCEKLAENILINKEEQKQKIVNHLMKLKIDDAQKSLNRERNNNLKGLKNERMLLREYNIENLFYDINNQEKRTTRHRLRNKREKKTHFLLNKYGGKRQRNKNRTDDDIEGIVIKDQNLPEDYESKPRCYGGTTLSKEEEDILSLSPNYAIYEEINIEKCEIEIEKSLTKLRWSEMKKKEDLEYSEDIKERDEDEEGSSMINTNEYKENIEKIEDERNWPYCIETNTLDLRNLRPTDLPFNKYVILPEPMKLEKEIEAQNLKESLLGATRAYKIQENMKRGEMKESARNLSKSERRGIKSLKKRENIVISQTDKSGRFSIDTYESYTEKCNTHILGDEEIDQKEYEKNYRTKRMHMRKHGQE